MNFLKSLFFKTITVPVNNEVREVTTVQTWRVEWTSRDGAYSADLNKEVEVFTNEQDARDFKAALDAAFKLIRHTSNIGVQLKKSA